MKIVFKKDTSLLTEATNISLAALRNRPKRVAAIIRKIQNEEPFELTSGEQVVLDKSNLEPFIKVSEGDFSKESISAAFGKDPSPVLKTADGRNIRLTFLKKTAELGGKGSEFHLSKEIAAKGQLQELIEKALVETQQSAITINFKNKDMTLLVVDGITGIDSQSKIGGVDPKADFKITRENNKPAIYISHKDGTTAKDFGQWSGTSRIRAGEQISEHPEVIKFANDLKKTRYVTEQNGMYFLKTDGITIGRIINDINLKLMGIFGNQYNKNSVGSAQNVDIVAQGLFKLTQNEDGTFNLTCNHMMGRQAFDDDFGVPYTPILICRHDSSRASHGIKNARILIYPFLGRKVSEYI